LCAREDPEREKGLKGQEGWRPHSTANVTTTTTSDEREKNVSTIPNRRREEPCPEKAGLETIIVGLENNVRRGEGEKDVSEKRRPEPPIKYGPTPPTGDVFKKKKNKAKRRKRNIITGFFDPQEE